MYSLGHIPDTKDERDHSFRSLQEYRSFSMSPPEEVDSRSEVPEILDQEALGSCVAHGGFGAIRLKNIFDGIKDPKIGNRLHGYWMARAYQGNTDWDAGSQIRNFFRGANEYGFMPEDETKHGYDIATYKDAPSSVERRKMFDQKNKGAGQVRYYRISEDGESRKLAMQVAMSNKGVIEMGVRCNRQFLDHTGLDVLAAPKDGDEFVGGHAFYLAGYNKHGVWKVGSWGDGWGHYGIGLISWDYILWEQNPDIWVVDRAPYFSHLVK